MLPFSYKKRSKVVKTQLENSILPEFNLNGHKTRKEVVLGQQIYMVDALLPEFYPFGELVFLYNEDLAQTSISFEDSETNIVRYIFKNDGTPTGDFVSGHYVIEIVENDLNATLVAFIELFKSQHLYTYSVSLINNLVKVSLLTKTANNASIVITNNPNNAVSLKTEYYSPLDYYKWTNTGLKYNRDAPTIYREDQRQLWVRSAETRNNEQVDFFEIPQYGKGNIVNGLITEDIEYKLANNLYPGLEAYNQDLYTLLESDLTRVVVVDQIDRLEGTDASKNYEELEYYADLSNRTWSKVIVGNEDYQTAILNLWDDYMINGVNGTSPIKEDIEAHDVSGRHENIYNSPFYLVRERHPNAAFDQFLIEIPDEQSMRENLYEIKDNTNGDIPFQDLKPEYNSSYKLNLSAGNAGDLYEINEWDLTRFTLDHHPFVEETRYTDIDSEILQVLTNYKVNDEQQREQLILSEDWIPDEVIYTSTGYTIYQTEATQGIIFNEMLRR